MKKVWEMMTSSFEEYEIAVDDIKQKGFKFDRLRGQNYEKTHTEEENREYRRRIKLLERMLKAYPRIEEEISIEKFYRLIETPTLSAELLFIGAMTVLEKEQVNEFLKEGVRNFRPEIIFKGFYEMLDNDTGSEFRVTELLEQNMKRMSYIFTWIQPFQKAIKSLKREEPKLYQILEYLYITEEDYFYEKLAKKRSENLTIKEKIEVIASVMKIGKSTCFRLRTQGLDYLMQYFKY